MEEAEEIYNRVPRNFEAGAGVAGTAQLSWRRLQPGDLDSAYEFAARMMTIAQGNPRPSNLARAHDQMGLVLLAKQDLRGAEREFLSALKYEEQLGHRSDLAFTLSALGRVYEAMGAASQAESVLRRAGLVFREAGLEYEAERVEARLRRME